MLIYWINGPIYRKTQLTVDSKIVVATAVCIGVSMGIPGALLASWWGDRGHRLIALALGAAGTLVALYLLLEGMTKTDFLVALALYNFFWNFSLTFQYAAVADTDNSGRSVAAAPAFHGAGGALGPAAAAMFVATDHFFAVNVLAAVAVTLSLVLFAFALRQSKSVT